MTFHNIILFADLENQSQRVENRNTYILGKKNYQNIYMYIFKRIIGIVHDITELLRSDNIYMCLLHPTNNELLSCLKKKTPY